MDFSFEKVTCSLLYCDGRGVMLV